MRIRRFVLYTLLLVIFHRATAQQATPAHETAAAHETGAARERTDPFLRDLLRRQASPALLHVLDHPDSFRYQLIYTRIDRDKDNRPHFNNYYFRVNPLEYYNPASTVKMPLGQGPINRRLWQLGYPDIRITRRFMPMTEDENRHTNPIRFGTGSHTLYRQPPAVSDLDFDFSHQILIGDAYYDRHDSLVHAPMDFTRHNNFPLEDAQQIMQSVLFPESVPAARRFHLNDRDERFLYQYMSEYPGESAFPHYDTVNYFNGYTKFFFFRADRTPIPSYIRSFNKPGWSYGFATDIAYIADFRNKVEFMLSGTIYVNRDGILNDDKYEYEEIAYPFFKETGNIIYQYELQRKRAYRPDLSRFVLSYD
jgi:hypothetical protein